MHLDTVALWHSEAGFRLEKGDLDRLRLKRGLDDVRGFCQRGIDITPEGEALARSGRPSKGLYGLGPMGAGSIMEITAMPDIREQCASVAERIAADLVREALPRQGSGRAALRIGG